MITLQNKTTSSAYNTWVEGIATRIWNRFLFTTLAKFRNTPTQNFLRNAKKKKKKGQRVSLANHSAIRKRGGGGGGKKKKPLGEPLIKTDRLTDLRIQPKRQKFFWDQISQHGKKKIPAQRIKSFSYIKHHTQIPSKILPVKKINTFETMAMQSWICGPLIKTVCWGEIILSVKSPSVNTLVFFFFNRTLWLLLQTKSWTKL